MQLEIQHDFRFGDRPPVPKPDPQFYQFLGEEGLRKLVSRHYDLLRKSRLRKMFPVDEEAFELDKRNSADFFIQLMGVPDYYNQRRGRPALVNRHSTFPITPSGRDVWLSCYREALLETPVPDHLIHSFWNYLNVFSVWMVNSYTKIAPPTTKSTQ